MDIDVQGGLDSIIRTQRQAILYQTQRDGALADAANERALKEAEKAEKEAAQADAAN